jgi:hypothetical protein
MRKKSKLTEQDLLDLGFEKKSETVESSGSKNDWHYYTLDIADVCLITNDNEHADVNAWFVYIFDKDGVVFKTSEETAQLVQLLQRNQTKNG